MTTVHAPAARTFDEQVRRLVEVNHPTKARWNERRFRDTVEPLRDIARAAEAEADPHRATVPALLVITGAWVSPEVAMADVEWKGRAGRVEMPPTTPADYETIDEVRVPQAPAYLLLDVDTGPDLQGERPEDALITIRERGRTPLTIDEGVALLVQNPSILADRNAYSLLASRQPGSQRVPAIWTSFKAPRLGWCWDRNPHTWLGSASASSRVAPVA